jgi:hypothetical protein
MILAGNAGVGHLMCVGILVFAMTNVCDARAQSRDIDEIASLNRGAIKLYEAGRYPEAAAAGERSLEHAVAAVGDGHPATIGSLDTLALVYRRTHRREPRTLSHGNALLWTWGRSGTGSPAMTAIPLHIQRRIEQRWASRFTQPAASDAPKNGGAKATPSTARCPTAGRELAPHHPSSG